MYADRYGSGPQIRPVSTTLAAAMTALPVVALILGLQISHMPAVAPIMNIIDVPIDKAPPEDPPKPQPETVQPPIEKIVIPPLPTEIVKPTTALETTTTTPDGPPMTATPGTGEVIAPPTPVDPPKPVVTVNAQIDSRGAFQPPYPAEEIRAGRNGRVSVRVLIGADGRVKQVVRLSATSDAFYNAAEKQALGKWRFKPATKDGEAFEQWKVMNLSFVLNEG